VKKIGNRAQSHPLFFSIAEVNSAKNVAKNRENSFFAGFLLHKSLLNSKI